MITDGESVSIDSSKAYRFVSDTCACLGLGIVCAPDTPKPKKEYNHFTLKRLMKMYKKYVEVSRLQREGKDWVDYSDIWC